MLKWTPQLSDRHLMGLGRQRGPAVDNSATDAITAQSANQFANDRAAENAQANLDLNTRRVDISEDHGGRSLAQNDEQFNANLGQRSNQFDARLESGKNQFDSGLAFEKEAFGKTQGLRRDELDYNRNAGRVASGISAVGLGLSGVEAYNSHNRSKEYKEEMGKMITQYKQMGTQEGDFYARMIELLGE